MHACVCVRACARARRSEVVPLPGRPGWSEQFLRWRSTSLASFQLVNFPYVSGGLGAGMARMPLGLAYSNACIN